MQKLVNVSLYGNFAAGELEYVPFKSYTSWPLPAKLLNGFLPKDPATVGEELWFFGPKPPVAEHYVSRSFGIEPKADREGENYHRIVADSWYYLDEIAGWGRQKKITAIIDVEFLACLYDPRPCIGALKKLMLNGEVHCIFIQRRSAGGARHWTRHRFETFLYWSGFKIGAPIPTDASLDYAIQATLTRAYYSEFLSSIGLSTDALNADFLVITTEDASLIKTGGIGTYVANLKRLNRDCIVLYAAVPAGAGSHTSSTVIAEKILGGITNEQMFEGDGLLEAVHIMLYTLPNLKIIEFQDYLSIGFRIVQAKKTGGLPSSVALRVFLHGNVDYLKRGFETRESATYSPSDLRSAIKDRFVFEEVDEVVAPSEFILNLMHQEFGYRLNNPRVQRHPFDLSLISSKPERIQFSQPESLVFIGKFSRFKGWPDFVQAVELMEKAHELNRFKRIVILAPGELPPEDKARLERCLPHEHLHLTHAEMMTFLNEQRANALFVVPAGCESYGFVALELLLVGCCFVGYRRGGVVEVIEDQEYLDWCLSEPNAESLATKIREILALSCDDRSRRVFDAVERAWSRQDKINSSWTKTIYAPQNPLQLFEETILDQITVATPVFNTPIPYLEDLARSIRSSSIRAFEWIIVDDGSRSEYAIELQRFCENHTDLRARLVRQQNKGLAGARNCGLNAAKTRFVYFMDSDDAFLPHTLSHAAVAMGIQRKRALAVSGFAVYFETMDKMPRGVSLYRSGHYWKPLGVSGARTLALLQNEFVTSASLVDVELASQLGGWDESDRSTWEDWAFYLKATWSNHVVLLIPWPGFLYRNTPESMSKTSNQYFGIRRLARNIAGHDRFEGNALLGLIQHGRNQGASLEETENLRRELARMHKSKSWKVTAPLRTLQKVWHKLRRPLRRSRSPI